MKWNQSKTIFFENVYLLGTYYSSHKDTLWITHRHHSRVGTLNCQQVALYSHRTIIKVPRVSVSLGYLKQSSVTYTVVTRSALQAPAAQSAVLSSKQLLTVKQAHTTTDSSWLWQRPSQASSLSLQSKAVAGSSLKQLSSTSSV